MLVIPETVLWLALFAGMALVWWNTDEKII